LTSVAGVLADHSAGTDRVESGSQNPAICTLDDGTITVSTAQGMIVLFAYAEPGGVANASQDSDPSKRLA
jgi:hypothetical protein